MATKPMGRKRKSHLAEHETPLTVLPNYWDNVLTANARRYLKAVIPPDTLYRIMRMKVGGGKDLYMGTAKLIVDSINEAMPNEALTLDDFYNGYP